MTEVQKDAWWDYLLNYGIHLAGCPLVVDPVPGGSLAFGPSNTPAIGVAHPPLNREDIELLLELYLERFALTFALSITEVSSVAAHLRTVAQPEITNFGVTAISVCEGAGLP